MTITIESSTNTYA